MAPRAAEPPPSLLRDRAVVLAGARDDALAVCVAAEVHREGDARGRLLVELLDEVERDIPAAREAVFPPVTGRFAGVDVRPASDGRGSGNASRA